MSLTEEAARAIYSAHMRKRHADDQQDWDELYRLNSSMPLSGPGFRSLWESTARAAIAVVLERAAKVADERARLQASYKASATSKHIAPFYQHGVNVARDIGDIIRSLAPDDGGSKP